MDEARYKHISRGGNAVERLPALTCMGAGASLALPVLRLTHVRVVEVRSKAQRLASSSEEVSPCPPRMVK